VERYEAAWKAMKAVATQHKESWKPAEIVALIAYLELEYMVGCGERVKDGSQ